MTVIMRNNKVYIEIVKKLKEMIVEDGLKPGDKLPSERELSEHLSVGRSSVREALRALELLGLIETRRGEGTFFREAHGNQLVQILGAFILQDERAREDVVETRRCIEMDCLRLIMKKNNVERLLRLKKRISREDFSEEEFFKEIARLADNFLIYRIWLVLNDYCMLLNIPGEKHDRTEYTALVDALIKGDESRILAIYRKLRPPVRTINQF